MSASTTSSTSVYTTPVFWERLWRTSGIQSLACFIIAYVIYGHQPQVGASSDALVALQRRSDADFDCCGVLNDFA